MTKKYVRVGFTSAQKTELWERWRSGEQMKSVGRELGKRSSSIFSHIRSTGGPHRRGQFAKEGRMSPKQSNDSTRKW